MSAPDVREFLLVPTPDEWLAEAQVQLPTLLIDHANCEKKAASTALALMYRYVDHSELLHKMSRLAREELRHFEQVLDLMQLQGVEYIHVSPARYAQGLHALVRKQEPERLVDTLILGAVVEARSCERFMRLIEVLPEPIAELYQQLVKSEARHYADYLTLASNVLERSEFAKDQENFANRVNAFLECDRSLVTSMDPQFRFHSGVPAKSTQA